MKPRSYLAVGLLVLAACASASTGGARKSSSVISQEEITAAGPSTLYELIQNVRPIWLRKRVTTVGNELKVYLDGTLYGTVLELRNLYTTDVASIEYYDARRAQARFGAGHLNGAVLLRSPTAGK